MDWLRWQESQVSSTNRFAPNLISIRWFVFLIKLVWEVRHQTVAIVAKSDLPVVDLDWAPVIVLHDTWENFFEIMLREVECLLDLQLALTWIVILDEFLLVIENVDAVLVFRIYLKGQDARVLIGADSLNLELSWILWSVNKQLLNQVSVLLWVHCDEVDTALLSFVSDKRSFDHNKAILRWHLHLWFDFFCERHRPYRTFILEDDWHLNLFLFARCYQKRCFLQFAELLVW